MPVAFEEYPGYPKFRGSASELTAIRKGVIAWSDINEYYQELFPVAVANVPQLPALFPGSTVIYAESVDFEPLFEEDEIASYGPPNSYSLADVTVNYKTLSFDSATGGGAGNPIITRRISAGGSVQTIPNGKLKWGDEDEEEVKTPDISAAKILCSQEYHITLHRVSPAYYANLKSVTDQLVGHTNDATFEGIGAEKFLFLGAEFNQTLGPGTDLTWQVELKMQSRNIPGFPTYGWNHFLDPKMTTATWRRLKTANGEDIHPTADFDDLYYIP